jgi:hypothetical protein
VVVDQVIVLAGPVLGAKHSDPHLVVHDDQIFLVVRGKEPFFQLLSGEVIPAERRR